MSVQDGTAIAANFAKVRPVSVLRQATRAPPDPAPSQKSRANEKHTDMNDLQRFCTLSGFPKKKCTEAFARVRIPSY